MPGLCKVSFKGLIPVLFSPAFHSLMQMYVISFKQPTKIREKLEFIISLILVRHDILSFCWILCHFFASEIGRLESHTATPPHRHIYSYRMSAKSEL